MSIELVFKIVAIISMFLAIFGNGNWKLIGMIIQVIVLALLAIAVIAFEKEYIYFIVTIVALGYWVNEIKKHLNQNK